MEASKSYIDIAFIVPLKEEFQLLQTVFKTKAEYVEGTLFSIELELGTTGVSGVAILQDDMGKAAATRAADALIRRYEIGMMVVVGIAGGISNDAAIGDVCFTGTVIDVLENAKITDSGPAAQTIQFNSKFYSTDQLLTFAFKYVQLGQDVKSQFEDWQLSQHYAAKELVPGQFVGRGDKNEEIGIPQIHDGSVVCGAVSKSDFYNSNLKSIERKILALETESGGVFHSAAAASIPAITVRGICDYADKNKNKLEEQTGARVREIAAKNAVSFVKLQLFNPQFLRFLEDRRKHLLRDSPLLDLPTPGDIGASALKLIKETIHEQLRHTSPQYQGKAEGYRLPLPRVRRSPAMASVSPSTQRSDPISILEAVTSHRIVVIDLPRNYPDNSLPWIVAGELSLIEIDGSQAIPIVISGEPVKPQRGTIELQTEVDLKKIATTSGLVPVIVIVDFPGTSRSRIEFLKNEISKYPSARFVIINRANLNISNEGELVIGIGAEQLNVCDISFVEMSNFLQRTYEMPDQEAGVVALRLRNMFAAFRLSAHPSYFAGMASEMLSSLLRANRRAELLQIAVGGFLSFVVVTDKSSVVLSRTTREEFLRRLVYSKKVLQLKFDRPALVKFVQEFARQKDVELDPFEFLRAFQDAGVIHYETDDVYISLPFIESYLLASELVARPDDAESYFDATDKNFDFPTFDIYSELGPSEKVVAKIIGALTSISEDLAKQSNTRHILLTDEIHPIALDKGNRLRVLEGRLKTAFDDVVHSRPNSVEKQRLIDIAARVEDGAKAAQETARLSSRDSEANDVSALERPLRIWTAATILLGSGSERLSKEPKRELAQKIAVATSALMDRLLRIISKFDFGPLKAEIQTDAALRSILNIKDDQEITQEHRDFVMAVVDAYELSLLGYPVRAMFEVLGNAAGQQVLRLPVANIDVSDPIDDLVAKVWAAEIDAAKQKGPLIKSINALPDVPFLRIMLSQYFSMRVFWNHWDMHNRLALLDAAEAAIAPFNRIKDKGRIKRIIEKKKKQ